MVRVGEDCVTKAKQGALACTVRVVASLLVKDLCVGQRFGGKCGE